MKRVPDARAISRPWPSRPKPVTSVAAVTPASSSASDAARFSARIWSTAAARSAGAVRPWREPDTSTPVPEPLGQQQPVARSGAALAQQAVRVRGADDREAVLGLAVADGVAAGQRAARLAHLDEAPSKIAARVSRGRSSGNAAMDSANSTRPPIANTSERALAAAISPYVRASSTSGGKKSSVPMIGELVADPVDGRVVGRREARDELRGRRLRPRGR